MSTSESELPWCYAGTLDYESAIELLEGRRSQVLEADADTGTLYLCTHPPVITLGRHGGMAHVLADPAELRARGVGIVQASRGGDVTYHDGGQLMIYPVVRVGGVRGFVARLAEGIVQIAGAVGVEGAAWRDDPPGVWVKGRKLAACGLHVHRGVSVHGFALNVATAGTAWRSIQPCGLTGAAPVSVAELTGAAPSIAELAEMAGPLLCRALGRSPRQQRWPEARAEVCSSPLV